MAPGGFEAHQSHPVRKAHQSHPLWKAHQSHPIGKPLGVKIPLIDFCLEKWPRGDLNPRHLDNFLFYQLKVQCSARLSYGAVFCLWRVRSNLEAEAYIKCKSSLGKLQSHD